MKRAHIFHLWFYGERGKNKEAEKFYESIKDRFHIPKEFRSMLYVSGPIMYLPVLENSPEAAEMYAMMENTPSVKFGRISSRVYYSPKEMEQQPFFHTVLLQPLEVEGTGTDEYGTTFIDVPDALYRRWGMKSVGDVYVDRKFLKKNHKMGHLPPDIFVTAEVKELFEQNELTGVSFTRRLRDYKGRDMGEYYIMDIHNVLPPMSTTTWFEQNNVRSAYKKTERLDPVYLISDAQYEKEKLEGALDFNLTYEYIDNDEMRELVVSARVRDLMRKNKIWGRFTPLLLL